MFKIESIGQKVKELRLKKDLTLKDMSEKTGLSTGYLSQFERGITTIAVEYLVTIAKILDVKMNYFFSDIETSSKEDHNVVVRSYDQSVVRILNQNIYKSLSAQPEDKAMFPKIVEILPQRENEEIAIYPHHGEEFVYVLEGILIIYLNEKEYELFPGDSIHYLSTIPHNWANKTNKVVKFIVVHSPSDFNKQ